MTDVSVSVPLLLLFVLPGVVSGQHSSMVWWFSSPPPDDPLNSTHSFHPPLVMVIMLLICVFFFVGFIIIYIYPWQNESRSDLPFHARARLIVHRGLDSNLMESFPIFTYSAVKGLKIGMGWLECAVCLSEFQDDDKLRFLPQCSHTFHLKCIDEWLSSHATCPVCRTNLKENSSAVAMGAVLVDILGKANDPRSHRQEDANQSGMVNHVAAGVSNVEPNFNVMPSAVTLPTAKSLRFLSENASTKSGAKPSMMFLRSHSTGHSFHPPESYERFALRLPERWTFSITPPFIHRSSSSRSHREAAVAGGAASTSKPTSFPPFDRTGSRADAAGRSSWSATTSVQFQA